MKCRAEMVVVAGGGSAGRIAIPSGLVAQWDSAGDESRLSTWKSVETDSALREQSEGFSRTEQAALAPLTGGR
ncbi:MAG: hypothetical protein IPG44_11535 [Anaerolineales bacterium]|nr:hypothetical protein [Anaerolineales bacterium]